MRKYIQQYITMIKQAKEKKEDLEFIIDRIYQDGFEDGRSQSEIEQYIPAPKLKK